MDGIQPVAEAHVTLAFSRAQERVAPGAEATEPTPLPKQPPVEVLASMDRAAQVVSHLEEQDVYLHFEVGDDRKVRIQLVDQQGAVVREIPQEKAVQLLSGGLSGVAVDELG